MEKDVKYITPDMVRKTDCACKNKDCVYNGYCELCKKLHASLDGDTACQRKEKEGRT